MRDQRQRELERRYREAGTLEAEEAWLHERLRAGAVDRDRLAFAAFLGHSASQRILEVPDPDLPSLPRLKRVLRSGIRLSSGELGSIEEPSLVQAWAGDCAERVLCLAAPHEEALRDHLKLARRAAQGEDLPDSLVDESSERLGQMARTREWEERGWRSVQLSVVSAFDTCRRSSVESGGAGDEAAQADRRKKRRTGQLALAAAEHARAAVVDHTGPEIADREASWQLGRLVDLLLDRAGAVDVVDLTPLISELEDLGRSAPSRFAEEAEVVCHFFLIAKLAVLPSSLRQAVWETLGKLAQADEGAVQRLPVDEATEPGWFQLHVTRQRFALDPRAWIDRAKGRRPPEAFLLCFQQNNAVPPELVLIGRWRWLHVDRRFGMDGGTQLSARAAEGSEELPSPPVDACSLLGEHAGLEPEKGLTVQALREATEYLAGVLESWEAMSEAERQAAFEAHPAVQVEGARVIELERSRAARTPGLQAKSVEVLAGRDLAREGATIVGRCPQCSQEGDLRVFAARRFVLCYPCYFDWW